MVMAGESEEDRERREKEYKHEMRKIKGRHLTRLLLCLTRVRRNITGGE